MRNEYSSLRRKMGLWAALAMVTLVLGMSAPALAKTVTATLKADAKVYEKASKTSKVMGEVSKGNKVTVSAVKGAWVRIIAGDKKGYIVKSAVTGKEAKQPKDPGVTFEAVQNKLVSKGYLKSSAATGHSNEATEKAIRIFQMVNGLGASGKANDSTVKKIVGGGRKKPSINKAEWSKSGINSAFRKRGLAVIVDLSTGARIRIRRVGGHNHLDVEPKTAKDTALLKKVYGGAWSWDSRPILLIAGGRYYAAAMNGMPHGAQISKTNNFEGQFCVHLNGSTTHGSEKENPLHQTNVQKSYNYLDS